MRFIIIIIILAILPACKSQKVTYVSPPGYDLQKPYIINLPEAIDEISGLSYYAKDKSVFAISDEKGMLYKITPGIQTKINNWKFSKKADFEDVVLHDSTFYILKSNGAINVVKFAGSDSITDQEIEFPYGKKNEFETLYYNELMKRLILICKDCDQDSKKSLTTFSFDPATLTYSDSSFSIDVKEIAKKMGIDKFRFKPSAAAIHPITHELFIISSVNKLLLVLDPDNTVKGYYKLNPGLFKQPEGLTFSETGKLIISNESAKVGTANLLIYDYAIKK
jgi:uncharacterized protein YjiK